VAQVPLPALLQRGLLPQRRQRAKRDPLRAGIPTSKARYRSARIVVLVTVLR
jgi:hypothetical protein